VGNAGQTSWLGQSHSTVAKRTGYSKSYISQVINGKIKISDDFMCAYIKLTGCDRTNPAEWGALFDVDKIAQKSKHFTKDNYAKYNGHKEYDKYTVFGKERKRDKAASLDRLDAPEPISAIVYYDAEKPPIKINKKKTAQQLKEEEFYRMFEEPPKDGRRYLKSPSASLSEAGVSKSLQSKKRFGK
jgi:hypothetical protein